MLSFSPMACGSGRRSRCGAPIPAPGEWTPAARSLKGCSAAPSLPPWLIPGSGCRQDMGRTPTAARRTTGLTLTRKGICWTFGQNAPRLPAINDLSVSLTIHGRLRPRQGRQQEGTSGWRRGQDLDRSGDGELLYLFSEGTRFFAAEAWPGENFPQCAKPPDNTLDPFVGLQPEDITN